MLTILIAFITLLHASNSERANLKEAMNAFKSEQNPLKAIQALDGLELDPTKTPLSNLLAVKSSFAHDWKTLLDNLNRLVVQEAFVEKKIAVIGAGPCGIKTAIGLATRGQEVHVFEKRSAEKAFTRINRLYLWKEAIDHVRKDLRVDFFDPEKASYLKEGKPNIGIGNLQISLFKVALLLGVKFHFNTQDLQVSAIEGTWKVNGDEFRSVVVASSYRSFEDVLPDNARAKFGDYIYAGTGHGQALVLNYRLDSAKVKKNKFQKKTYDFARHVKREDYEGLKTHTGLDSEIYIEMPSDEYMYVVAQISDKQHQDIEQMNALEKETFARKIAEYRGFDFVINEVVDVSSFGFKTKNRSRSYWRGDDEVPEAAVVGDAFQSPFWVEGLGVTRGFMGVSDVVWALTQKGYDAQSTLDSAAVQSKSVGQYTQKNILKDGWNYLMVPWERYRQVSEPQKLAIDQKYDRLPIDTRRTSNDVANRKELKVDNQLRISNEAVRQNCRIENPPRKV